MKSLFLLPLFLLGVSPQYPVQPFVDPTGTYILKGKVRKNRITGHSGEIRARLLDRHKVALCLYVNDGYPDYASGAVIDTLDYEDNTSYYQPAHDSSCFMIFKFGSQKVEITEVYSDPHSGCGFAPGIMIPATFEKSSSDIPVIQDLSKRGLAAGGAVPGYSFGFRS